MKYFIKYKLAFLFIGLMLVFGACTKNYEEINTSPNSPTDVPGEDIFTHVIVSSVGDDNYGQLGGWIQHTYLGGWSQQWCKVQYIDEDRYQTRDMSAYFEGPYTNMLMDLRIIIDKATQDIADDVEVSKNSTLLAASKIMRVWIFDYLTDLFGDVPYTEALEGLMKDGVTTPVYDTQESIYTSFFTELEEANTLLDLSKVTSFGTADLFFNGDPAKWKKFGNSLKLRLLNRVAGTPWSFTYNMVGGTPVTTTAGAAAYANADAEIAAILNDPTNHPIMESNDDDVMVVYPGTPYRNPIYNTLYSRTDQAISETMVNWLLARNDPRLPVYAQTTTASDTSAWPQYYGFQNGSDLASAYFPEISLLGTAIAYDENAPLYVLTYDEVQFIIAEYEMRMGQVANAQAAYEEGIAASMDRWGVDVGTYLSEPDVDWGAATTDGERYQRICEQRWAAIYGEGVQAYNLVRRTGFPERVFEYELTGTYYPGLGLPVRITYSLNEEVYNTANLQEAKTRQNVETSNAGMFSTSGISSQLWWNTRKNPIPTVTDPQ